MQIACFPTIKVHAKHEHGHEATQMDYMKRLNKGCYKTPGHQKSSERSQNPLEITE